MGAAALKQLVTVGFQNTQSCPPESAAKVEDISVSECMDAAGISLSREAVDRQGRDLFHALSHEGEFVVKYPEILPHGAIGNNFGNSVVRETLKWYRHHVQNKLFGGEDCCPKEAITYHRIEGHHMMFMDYLFRNYSMKH